MKKITLAIFVFLSLPLLICAQKKRTEDFKFILPEQKVQNSLYSSIRFIDARYDTTSVGIIQRGIFNDRVMLVTKQPLEEQVGSVLTALIDSTAKRGELILHVRQFSMAEITRSFSEKGYCYLRANLFAGKNGSYKLLDKFDSIVVVKASDVTKDLLKTGSEVITSFIAGNLLKESVETEAFSLMIFIE